jgi:hypothetical protein
MGRIHAAYLIENSGRGTPRRAPTTIFSQLRRPSASRGGRAALSDVVNDCFGQPCAQTSASEMSVMAESRAPGQFRVGARFLSRNCGIGMTTFTNVGRGALSPGSGGKIPVRERHGTPPDPSPEGGFGPQGGVPLPDFSMGDLMRLTDSPPLACRRIWLAR